MPNSRITLYLPDLAAVLRRPSKPHLLQLGKILSRAIAKPVAGDAALLADCFGLQPEQIAVASLEQLAITGVADTAYWWRADPVHLAADRDQLVMLPRTSLAVTGDEMRQLAETFNRNYGAEGFQLEFRQPEHGYLRVPANWHCLSWNPAWVEGQVVTEFMPAGPHSDALKKLMTEIQMLWHEHPVNQAREAAGKPAINSLWLWGGGRLPDKVTQPPERVIAGLPLVRGLAKLAGQASDSWSADLDLRNVEGDWLIALSVHDFSWDVHRLEQELVAPLWRALFRGWVQQIRFYPGGDHLYELTRRRACRFWRRTRPVSELLRGPNDQPAD